MTRRCQRMFSGHQLLSQCPIIHRHCYSPPTPFRRFIDVSGVMSLSVKCSAVCRADSKTLFTLDS